MKFEPLKLQDGSGRELILRNADLSDAEDLIKFMKITAEETPFLIREPEEVSLTLPRQQDFLKEKIDSEKDLLLIAAVNGEHAGNCALMSAGPFLRYRHRCRIAIALYRKYWGEGIGTAMLRAVLETARKCGYEQAELEVIEGNEKAMGLYKKIGFEVYGRFPNNMKYADGTYADAYWMMKQLQEPLP